jgi:hypothetical protein
MLKLDKDLPRSARAPERIRRLEKHESVELKDKYPFVGWRKISRWSSSEAKIAQKTKPAAFVPVELVEGVVHDDYDYA